MWKYAIKAVYTLLGKHIKIEEMEKSDCSRHEMEFFEFGLDDFIDDKFFEQCVQPIADENFEHAIQFSSSYDYGHISDCDVLLQDMSSVEVEDKGGESSGTSSRTKATSMKRKPDRSKTLISERKRRGRMKEMLHELRSLVPNITKMDKASIIADAVLYIQELQNRAKNLQTDIASLESPFSQSDEGEEESNRNAEELAVTGELPAIKNISQMDVIQVDDRNFYGRIICNKGQGIATLLYRALESLEIFEVHGSCLATAGENYILTFALNAEGFEVGLNLPRSLKLWIASALLNQGFYFVTQPEV